MLFLIMRLNYIFNVYTGLSLFLFHILALAGGEQEVLKALVIFAQIRYSVTDMHSV